MDTADQLQIYPGSRLGKFYEVEEFLGEGGFGYVTKCRNIETNEVVAIKVNKSHPNIVHQAREEIANLKKLRSLDPDTYNIVKWNGFFFHKEHICLNFELLNQSLRNYIWGREHKGLTMTELRPILHQLATTFCHLRSMDLVHADLKPDNIMVVNPEQQPLKVKVIDFGLARQVSAVQPGDCVQTTWYRAPEVMLQLPFNEAIDMWSLGLVAVELATGYPLYTGYSEYDMLCCIIETQGLPPDHVLDRGMATSFYFDQQDSQQRWVLRKPEEMEAETGFYPGQRRFPVPKCLDDIEERMVNDGEHQGDRCLLIDLIKRMLHLDPDQRIKPLEVLQHPFFAQNLPESSSPDTSMEKVDNKETPEVYQVYQTSGPHVHQSSVEDINEQRDTSDEMAGELQIIPGSRLGEFYEVEELLGKGGFGCVSKCRHTETNEVVAIKCIRDHPETGYLARQEIAVLEKLRCLDPDTCNIVGWNGYFHDKDHTCLTFELLDQSLYKYLQYRYNNGLTTTELRPIIHQLATALNHLSSAGVVHGNLKPDNVMIVNHLQQPLKVKLVDFGMARPVSQVDPNICVGSTWYRAPEAMLQIPHNEAADMWSLGLVVVELAVGYPLYPGDTVYEMLHLITKTQGLPPNHVLECGMKTEYFFNKPRNGQQHWTFKTPEEFVDETGENPTDLGFVSFRCLDDIEQVMNDGEHQGDRCLLIDLIKRMLHLDPDQRIKPLEVLQHPFFAQNLPESSSPDTSMEKVDNKETPEVYQAYHTSEPHVHQSSVEDINEQSDTSDEMAGELQIIPGSRLGEFYEVEELLGKGGFGCVSKCRHTETNEVVAIKCIRDHPETGYLARQEIAVLEKLRCLDPDTCNIVGWNGYFHDKDHTCLTFELLDQSLYKYLQYRYNNGLTMTELRPIIHQLATALNHLSSAGVVHGNLKPDNVMIVNHLQQPLKVKLVDFGMARPVSQVDPNICVGSTWYRAPEAMLQIPHNEAADMWSLGLVVVELAVGYPLYPGDTVYEMLHLITKTQGLPPNHVLECGMKTEYFFNKPRNGQQHWTFKTPEEFVDETGENPTDLGFVSFRCLDDIEQVMNDGEDQSDRCLLIDLIKRMLHLDPDKRIKPLEVLQHPFFAQNLPESSSPDTSMEKVDNKETPEVYQAYHTSEPHVHQSSIEDINEQSDTSDEMAGELQIIPGSRLGEFYEVEELLGKGGFGCVSKCHHTETNEVVAIKCIRDHPETGYLARQEIAVLEKLRCLDPDTCNIVGWNGYFHDKDHTCLTFELLDQSLYKYLQYRYNNGLTTTELRPIIHQLATALNHLSSAGVVHGNLKPDNVMIVNHLQQPLKVKLVDFGMARPVSQVDPNICVGSTWYRAPEAMLQIPHNEAADMWSLGLVVVELAVGYPLYPGDTVYEMLHLITNTQGLPPNHVLECGMKTEYFFNKPRNGQQHWTFKTPEEFVDETGENPTDLGFVSFRCLDDIEQVMNDGEDQSDRCLLIDLIKRMLHLDPDQRIKPLEVLQHPFFAQNLPESSSPDTSMGTLDNKETPEVNQVDSRDGYPAWPLRRLKGSRAFSERL